jgi:DNA-binding response OmpR family regulator|tara:strand:- start:723 stop:1700 length:978 start_codon:yes stop_codon:yes gene_type:complete
MAGPAVSVTVGGSEPGMDKRKFDTIDVVLGDGMRMSRRTVMGILQNLGFREVIDIHSVEDLRKHFSDTPVDLLVCDLDLSEGSSSELFHEIRHGSIGSDPFIPILSYTWEPRKDLVEAVIKAGADTLLTMPMSVAKMENGLNAVIERRRPFVVTTDYIGPDRRSGQEREEEEEEIPVITVPNALRRKATGQPDEVSAEECLRHVQEQKVERHAYQVGYLTKIIRDHFSGQTPDAAITAHIERLRFVAGDLSRRIGATRFHHQAELCQSMVQVAENLAANPGAVIDRDLRLLDHLATAIELAVKTDDEATLEAASEISSAIRQSRG